MTTKPNNKLKPKYKSSAYEAIHSSARALHKVGAIDKATIRSFDESCLSVPTVIKPQQIKNYVKAITSANPSSRAT
jgi:putative transcriptional regulator